MQFINSHNLVNESSINLTIPAFAANGIYYVLVEIEDSDKSEIVSVGVGSFEVYGEYKPIQSNQQNGKGFY